MFQATLGRRAVVVDVPAAGRCREIGLELHPIAKKTGISVNTVADALRALTPTCNKNGSTEED